MSEIQSILGVDLEDLEWDDLALCQNMDLNNFYDDYESDPTLAKEIDNICLTCPVQKECLMSGMENKQHGVWGGVYLTLGQTDPDRNKHKTPDIWKEIRKRTTE